jgi:hypothetical protein
VVCSGRGRRLPDTAAASSFLDCVETAANTELINNTATLKVSHNKTESHGVKIKPSSSHLDIGKLLFSDSKCWTVFCFSVICLPGILPTMPKDSRESSPGWLWPIRLHPECQGDEDTVHYHAL